METASWIQLLLFVGLLMFLTRPLGAYLYRVLESRQKTFFSPVIGGCEKWLLRALGRGSEKEQDWKQYGTALACFSLVGMLLTYFILRLQHFLPLNPQDFAGLDPIPGLQHRGEFRQQHRLAELRRRKHDVPFFADGGADVPEFRLGRRRDRGRRRPGAGNRQEDRPHDRQFLGRPRPRHPARSAAVVVPPGPLFHLPGGDPEFPGGCQTCPAWKHPRAGVVSSASPRGRLPRRRRSRSWAPTAGAFSTPIPPTLSKTRPR